MNFKTTLTLFIALVAVGAIVLLRGGKTEEPVDAGPKKLLAIPTETVNGVSVTSASGDVLSISKSADGNWSLTKPVTAVAEKFEADDLVRAVTSLESRGQVDVTPDRGFDKPQYTVNIQAGDKSHELLVGAASGVGENLYVKIDGGSKASIVPASLLERLEKPASAYRQPKLVTEPSTDIQQVTITQNGQTLALAKDGSKWTVIAPTTMPADMTVVNELLSAVTGLRAEEFVSEGSDTAAVGQPRLTVSYAAAPPSTQPATTQPVKTIVFGRFSDIAKKSVLATSPTIGAVVKVAATSLDAFNKKPFDLRDKQVLTINTSAITSIELKVDTAATTKPTTQPASSKQFTVTRRPPPATQPATTQATTAPAPSKWMTANHAPANDSAIDTLLTDIGTLKAEKFVETLPVVAQPVGMYALTIVIPPTGPSLGERYELRLFDFGNDTAPVATYNGLTFNVSRSLLTALQADLAKHP